MVRNWRDLRVLVVGCGSIGKRHARVLRELGVANILACDTNASRRDSLADHVNGVPVYDSFDSGLAEHPDAVIIGTPPELHIPMAIQALGAGCHVLVEKPLSLRSEGIDQLVAVAARTEKKVMVALCFRYHAGLRMAKTLLDAGRIGRLVSMRLLMGESLPDVRPDYRELFSAHDSGAFDLSHEVDLAVWFSGQDYHRVHAMHGSYSDIGIDAPDLAELLVEFPGCLASIHLDFFQRPRRRQTELIGTAGLITVEFSRWNRCTVSVFDVDKDLWEVAELDTDRDDMFREEDTEFLEAVAGDTTIECDIAEGRKSVEIIERARWGPPKADGPQ